MPPPARPPSSPSPGIGAPARTDRPGRALGRALWWLLAWTALLLGLIGVVLPGLPTTPFVLLAAYAAARGSPRMAAWLHRHRQFGPMIRDWQAHGAVSRRAKWLATVAMAACVPVLWWFSPNAWAHWPPIAVMAVVAVWLWRRPEGPAADAPGDDDPRQQAVEEQPAGCGHGWPPGEATAQAVGLPGARPDLRRTGDLKNDQDGRCSTSCQGSARRGRYDGPRG